MNSSFLAALDKSKDLGTLACTRARERRLSFPSLRSLSLSAALSLPVVLLWLTAFLSVACLPGPCSSCGGHLAEYPGVSEDQANPRDPCLNLGSAVLLVCDLRLYNQLLHRLHCCNSVLEWTATT